MIDQLIIGKMASYDDFGASVAERKITKPKKKSIKETVPFSNVTHDFSAINGELYWEEASLEYIFEIDANSAEELEDKKRPFVSWVMNVQEEELHDPYIRNFHYLATFADIDVDDSEVEKATITVKFTAYPYMICDFPKMAVFQIPEADNTVSITNNSSHRITPTFKASVECIITKGNSSYGIPAGEIKDDSITFNPGINTFSVRATGNVGTLTVEFREEVF